MESITPDKVRGLRDLLNSSAMDIMYYNSPLYRDEVRDRNFKKKEISLITSTVTSTEPDRLFSLQITKTLTQELNRLYTLFCSRNPEFEKQGGKVSIVSHSLGCVITYDIMTGWDPVRFCLQEHHPSEEEPDLRWMSYDERHLLEQLRLTRNRWASHLTRKKSRVLFLLK